MTRSAGAHRADQTWHGESSQAFQPRPRCPTEPTMGLAAVPSLSTLGGKPQPRPRPPLPGPAYPSTGGRSRAHDEARGHRTSPAGGGQGAGVSAGQPPPSPSSACAADLARTSGPRSARTPPRGEAPVGVPRRPRRLLSLNPRPAPRLPPAAGRPEVRGHGARGALPMRRLRGLDVGGGQHLPDPADSAMEEELDRLHTAPHSSGDLLQVPVLAIAQP